MSEDQENSKQDVSVVPVKVSLSDAWLEKLGDAHAAKMEELAPREWYDIDVGGTVVRFKRKRILPPERKTLEEIRATLRSHSVLNMTDVPEIEDKLYKKCAEYYLIDTTTNLPMSADQFNKIPFEIIRAITDACSFRTEREVPPLESQS